MLIDIHAYVGHWPFRQLRGNTCAGLLSRMDAHGVDKAVVANINGIFYKNTQRANEEIRAWIDADAAYTERLVPLAVLNPSYPGWDYDFEACRDRLGMKGLRLYPRYHDYGLDHPGLCSLLQMASEVGMPVAFSLRVVDARQRSWLDVYRGVGNLDDLWTLDELAPVIAAVPDGKTIILHARMRQPSPETIETLKRADVIFDVVRGSGVPIVGPNGYSIPEALKTFGPRKIAFGTATPFMDYASPYVRVETMTEEEAREDVKTLIWGGNAARMFGL